MVAEPRQITSLNKPPDGWVWSEEARARRQMGTGYNNQTDPLNPYSSRYTGGPAVAGPLPAAEATADLPEVTPGISTLPTSCTHCGSGFLAREPALNGNRRGMVTCNTCGRQVCWLRPSITTVRGPVSALAPTPAARSGAATNARGTQRPALTNPIEQLAGCGPACSAVFGHDPLTHERYGRAAAVAEMLERPTGIVRTGPLAIDFDTQAVTVNGADAKVWPAELPLIKHLACNLGRVCPQAELVAAAWGPGRLDGRGCQHLLRTTLSRLKSKLGAAKQLIETRPGVGYMLRAEPPIGGDA